MPKCFLCQIKFPNHVVVEGKKRNLQNRKYCIECSPFGQHNTRDIVQKKIRELDPNRFCSACNKFKLKNCFYKRRKKDSSSYCKECTYKKTLNKQQNFKQFCVNHKGGKCNLCGYDKCLGALEFHHRNHNEKDFNITRMRSKSITHQLLEELEKCLLVCANCHREIHYKHLLKENFNRKSTTEE